MKLDCKILHVEDSDDDSLFFQRALRRLNFDGAYRRVTSVDRAIAYLRGSGDFDDRRLFPIPDVIVMDTILEGARPTYDLVAWLAQRTEFQRVVKVMLTGATDLKQHQEWLSGGIDAVLFKGISAEELRVAVEDILGRC